MWRGGGEEKRDPQPNCFGCLLALLYSPCPTEFGGTFIFLKDNLSSDKSPTQNPLINVPEGGIGLVMAWAQGEKKESELSSGAFKASAKPPF